MAEENVESRRNKASSSTWSSSKELEELAVDENEDVRISLVKFI
jgi:hypothetical protein